MVKFTRRNIIHTYLQPVINNIFNKDNKKMTEKELQTYLQERFPCENEACDWKEMKSLKLF